MVALFLSAYFLVLAARLGLRWLNIRHLRRFGHVVPAGFEGEVDPATLRKTAAYTLERSRLGLAESAFEGLLLAGFLFGGLLGVYDAWIGSLTSHFVARGTLFFLGLFTASVLLSVPFNLYGTFGLEEKFGFNTATPGLWLSDLVKSYAVGGVLLAVLVAGALALTRVSPGAWWFWVWIFFALFAVFVLYISPNVIEPLFFRFTPITEEELEGEIRGLADKAGLRAGRILEVDASRRSRHSNAYFTGIGRVKRVVLFDTLLRQMARPEILAVLAHEIGHWKRRHVLKRLAVTQAVGLVALYLAFRLLGWEGLPGLVGLDSASFHARLFVVLVVASVAAFPLTPLGSSLSRRHEWEADRYAVGLTGRPSALAGALIKLARENLANLHPHPLYTWFFSSHPPIAQRVRRLLEANGS